MNKFLAFILLLLLPIGMIHAEWNSYIINFDKKLFGKGTQTWQIVPYDATWTFFANKNGLLQYNGNVWEKFTLHNGTDVRSVYSSAQSQRIYAGGINEFGYFEPGQSGQMIYHCMSDSIPVADRYFGNVWGIHEIDNILYFQGDGFVVKYLNDTYTFIPTECKIDYSNVINGTLYLGTEDGVKVLVGNTFFPLFGADELSDKRIKGIMPYNGGIMIATAYDGLYFYQNQAITPFITGAEEFLHNNEVFCMDIFEDKIALGTIHKGILLYDIQSDKSRYFNEYTGLQNNTVLSLSFDNMGNLWAGLDSGIAYVCISSAFSNLYTYPYSYGKGYAAVVENDRLYLGTNRGLYYTSYPVRMDGNQPDISPVPYSSGQVWGLDRVGDELFCLHDRGVFLLNDDGMQRIGEISGAWNCQQVMGRPDMLYVGTYSGIYVLQKRNNKWEVYSKIEGFYDSTQFFEQEEANILWVIVGGTVSRISVNRELTHTLDITTYGAEKGLPETGHIKLANVNNRICFSTPLGMFEYNPDNDQIESSTGLNNLLNGAANYARLITDHNRLISLSQHEICVSNTAIYKRGPNTKINRIHQSLLELVEGYETIIPVSDSTLIIPNEEGFALFTIPNERSRNEFDHNVFIQNMYLTYPKDSLIYTANFLENKYTPTIHYSNNSIRFEYGQSLYKVGDDIRFQYRLNNSGWSELTSVNTKEYSNLSEGEYTFAVKVIYPDGTTSQDSLNFVILPPWYRSWWVYSIYILLGCLILWFLYYLEEVRIRRKKRQIEVEKNKEVHKIERVFEAEKAKQEQHIMQLEKEKLEYDLKHKSQEMANLMINFLRKNEMLTEIKSEILKVASGLKGESGREGKQQLMVINNKIDSNIQNDEVLKRIEEEFDLIHNNFMKRLSEKHPNLSLNERIMCAYLKMNLSTKEIAPLLNISVRGVETLRYRLRKKLNLEREESLIDYLTHHL